MFFKGSLVVSSTALTVPRWEITCLDCCCLSETETRPMHKLSWSRCRSRFRSRSWLFGRRHLEGSFCPASSSSPHLPATTSSPCLSFVVFIILAPAFRKVCVKYDLLFSLKRFIIQACLSLSPSLSHSLSLYLPANCGWTLFEKFAASIRTLHSLWHPLVCRGTNKSFSSAHSRLWLTIQSESETQLEYEKESKQFRSIRFPLVHYRFVK